MKNRGRGVQLLLTRNPKKDFCPEGASRPRDLSSTRDSTRDDRPRREDSVLAGKDLSSRMLFLFLTSLHRYLVTSFPAQSLTLYMVMPLISLGKKSVDFWGMTSPDVAIFITWSTSQGFSKNEICARPLSTASSAASASRSYVKFSSAFTACGVMPSAGSRIPSCSSTTSSSRCNGETFGRSCARLTPSRSVST